MVCTGMRNVFVECRILPISLQSSMFFVCGGSWPIDLLCDDTLTPPIVGRRKVSIGVTVRGFVLETIGWFNQTLYRAVLLLMLLLLVVVVFCENNEFFVIGFCQGAIIAYPHRWFFSVGIGENATPGHDAIGRIRDKYRCHSSRRRERKGWLMATVRSVTGKSIALRGHGWNHFWRAHARANERVHRGARTRHCKRKSVVGRGA